ncbi:MAG: NAD(P)-dependent alcohol dehydrogenase [Candidatus Thorarchaeota archaeon]|nr:MAG: NAD(P)-dependent alcohol dehydrogenase [Candidatus Thorarchaeota archaeon]
MKAIVCPRYGPPEVLELREVPKPTPKDNEILIRNHATTVVLGDCEVRGFNFPYYSFKLKLLMRLGFGLRGPRKKILGQQLAGVVEEVGVNVTRFKPGDQVFACTAFGMGAYAQYKSLSETGLVTRMPSNMSFEEASTIPVGGSEALHFMTEADIQRGQTVLVNGAGGSIGTIALQLAKSKGAEVTAVDSAGKFDMLKSLGADNLIDYRQELFTERDETYDVIFDVVGVTKFSGCMKSLNENGIYLQGNGSVSRRDKSSARENNMIAYDKYTDYTTDSLVELKALIESATIRTVIDRTFPLEQMVEVHRFVEKGGKLGNVVVTMG